MNILIVGCCGTGKTWVMKELLKEKNKAFKIGLIRFHETDSKFIIGKYTGKTFDGSDSLSMAVMKDLDKFLKFCNSKDKTAIFEGDRFSNSKFISKAKPTVLKIKGDGASGRALRGSEQTERHLKSIRTRISNIKSDVDFNDSKECLEYINENY